MDAKADELDTAGHRQLQAVRDKVKDEGNHWTAFSMLRAQLGETTYKTTIRDAFGIASKMDVPETYQRLWALRIRGLLNLNLDRLAMRALSERHPGAALPEFNGREVARLRRLLNGHQPFIGNLHGISEDAQSWVLTRDELSGLLADESYRSFIDACLSTHTILFVGIGADDLAIGGHLERLASLNIELPTHFWLTSRRDLATDQWAEQAGIQLIRYTNRDQPGQEVSEFFDDLLSFVPEDPASSSPPVAPTSSEIGESDPLPSVDELSQWDSERIRQALNERAKSILNKDDASAYGAYEEFCDKYDQAIYRAWYTSTKPADNLLLGYELEREVAKGSFGKVYVATSPDGNQVAVKVLLEEIRSDANLLKSFRRGVRSMRILQMHEVDGMVAYLEASEIPAFVVMEWIDGPNLAQAVQAGYLSNWHMLTTVSAQLAQIIRRAHELPERVLHRDIRPSNVMLSGYYSEPDSWRVVVLDFDLSWHRGAFEKSVLHTTAAGYLAPEQMRSIPRVSTRNAAVDSFGLGMTLLYLCSGVEPLPDQHKHEGWESEVRRRCGDVGRPSWRSAPERFARLIIAATQDSQAARWDMAEITGELERLEAAVDEPDEVNSVELLTEEVAATADSFGGYIWDADRVRANREMPTGMSLSLEANVKDERVNLHIDWGSTGMEDRRNLGKYVTARSRSIAEQLTAAGWKNLANRVDKNTISISASLDVQQVRGRIAEVAQSIDAATRSLQFG